MNTQLLFVVFALTISMSFSKLKSDCIEKGTCKSHFKYTINNQLQSPFFRESIVLKIFPQQTMIKYMETSVLKKPKKFVNFRTKFSSPYGHLIETIHDLTSTFLVNKTYWEISNSSGPLDVGVSTYKPSPGDKILFNFTQWGI